MLTWEFVLIVVTLIQPPIVGLLLLGLTRLSLISTSFGSFTKTTRRRLYSAKFFECAAHPRLLHAAHYDIVAISLCVVFVLYDVDLVFFFVEAVCFEG
jgi:NADH:ubiquinone oxidoreductase subunit 3 (subunit A)